MPSDTSTGPFHCCPYVEPPVALRMVPHSGSVVVVSVRVLVVEVEDVAVTDLLVLVVVVSVLEVVVPVTVVEVLEVSVEELPVQVQVLVLVFVDVVELVVPVLVVVDFVVVYVVLVCVAAGSSHMPTTPAIRLPLRPANAISDSSHIRLLNTRSAFVVESLFSELVFARAKLPADSSSQPRPGTSCDRVPASLPPLTQM